MNAHKHIGVSTPKVQRQMARRCILPRAPAQVAAAHAQEIRRVNTEEGSRRILVAHTSRGRCAELRNTSFTPHLSLHTAALNAIPIKSVGLTVASVAVFGYDQLDVVYVSLWHNFQAA